MYAIYLFFILRDEIDATGPPLPDATAGPLCCFWAPDSAPDSHTWALCPACKLERNLGRKRAKKSREEKRVEKSRERPTPFVCLQHLCCHIIFNNFCWVCFGIGCWEPWKAATSHYATHEVQLCFTLILIPFMFIKIKFYILTPTFIFNHQSSIINTVDGSESLANSPVEVGSWGEGSLCIPLFTTGFQHHPNGGSQYHLLMLPRPGVGRQALVVWPMQGQGTENGGCSLLLGRACPLKDGAQKNQLQMGFSNKPY